MPLARRALTAHQSTTCERPVEKQQATRARAETSDTRQPADAIRFEVTELELLRNVVERHVEFWDFFWRDCVIFFLHDFGHDLLSEDVELTLEAPLEPVILLLKHESL
jgi:hypothetical protein